MKKIKNLVWASTTHTASRNQNKDWNLTDNATGDLVATQFGSGNLVGEIGDLEARQAKTSNRIERLQADLQAAIQKRNATAELLTETFTALTGHNALVDLKRKDQNAAAAFKLTKGEEAANAQDEANEDEVATDSRTKAELLILATDAGVVGRHRMGKAQLIAALA